MNTSQVLVIDTSQIWHEIFEIFFQFTICFTCEITITFLNLILDLKCFFNIPAEESIVYHTQTWLHVSCFFSILFSTETEGAPGFSFLKELLLVACSMLLVFRSLLSPEVLVHSPFSQ